MIQINIPLALLSLAVAGTFAQQFCFDKSVKCNKFSKLCNRSDHAKDRCPATCGRCVAEPSDDNLRTCCNQLGITSTCSKLCKYDVTFQEVYRAVTNNECVENDAKIWLSCATRGKDHSQCCESKNVMRDCMTPCKGRYKQREAFTCFVTPGMLDKVRTCFKEN